MQRVGDKLNVLRCSEISATKVSLGQTVGSAMHVVLRAPARLLLPVGTLKQH